MFAIENFISYEVVQKIGWVLLHFVWQAAAVTFVLAFILRILRRFSANTRYIAACLALLAVVLMPFITMQFIKVETPPAAIVEMTPPAIEPAITASEETFQTPSEKPANVVYIQPEPVVIERHINFKERAVTFIEPKLSIIVTLWLIGVFALAIWHLGGYAQLQKLRRKMVKQVDSSLHDKLKVLAQKLGVTQTVQLLESALVQIPTVIGWLKPVILLPASAITGLSTEQLEAILAHELAHIKRYDYLVNILQTIVEILGFYHPAVWWISHKIRCERENCCDDLAVAICGDKIHYAKALASMEEIRGRDQFAIAATGGNLFSRICRLLGKDSSEKNALSWIPALTVILLLIALAIPTTIAFTSGNIENEPKIQKDTEVQWGQAIDGVQIRLYADQTTWNAGETPELKLDAKNNGNRELLIYQTDQLCELTVDGQPYHCIGFISIKSSPFGPGKQYDGIEFSLNGRWHKIGDNGSLQLSSGKHIIQVTFELNDSRNGAIEPAPSPVIVQSNPVEIEILPNENYQTDDKSQITQKQVIFEIELLEVNEKYLQKEATLKELLKGVPIPTAGMSIERDSNKLLFSTAILDDFQINSLFNLKNENVKTLARPALIILDNEPATISTISKIPFVSVYTKPGNSNEISVPVMDQKYVDFTGTITPHIIPDKNDIILEYVLKNSIIAGYEERTYDENHKDKVPLITLREMESTALISRGKTFVANMGEVKPDANNPDSSPKKNLLVLIKPTIVTPEMMGTQTPASVSVSDEEDMIGPSPNEFIINTSGNTPTVKEKKESEEIPDNNMIQRTYDISDLVGPPSMGGYGGSMMGGMMNNPLGGYGGGYGGGMMGGYGAGGYGGYGGGYGANAYGGYGESPYGSGMRGSYGSLPNSAQELKNLIMQLIESDSWYELNENGKGTIEVFPIESPKKMTVTNTIEVHKKIEKLLESMRKELGKQVSLEIRYIYGSEQAISEIISSTGVETIDNAILDDTQVRSLIKGTQGIQNAKSLAAPRVTVLNGETAIFTNTEQQPLSPGQINPLVRITPLITHDKNNVIIDFNSRMALEQNDSNQISNISDISLTNIIIPNGKTYALSRYVNNEQAPSSDKKSLIVLIKPTIILQQEQEEEPLPGQESSGLMMEGNLEAATRSISGQSINTQHADPKQVLIETQILHVNNAFLKQLGLDANSLKESDTWSKYSVDKSNEPNIFVIDELSAALLQQTIDISKDVTVHGRPAIIAATGKQAIMQFLTETYYISTGSLSDSKQILEKVTVGPSINFTPEIVNQNKIRLNSEFKILENIQQSTVLKINDTQVMEGSMRLPKFVNLYGESFETIIPDGQTLLIIGNKISKSIEGKVSRPLINLPLIDGLLKVKSRYKIVEEYIQLFLVKPTIFSPEKAEKIEK